MKLLPLCLVLARGAAFALRPSPPRLTLHTRSFVAVPDAATAATNPAAWNDDGKSVNLLALNEAELKELVQGWGFPAFRAKQIHDFIFGKGVLGFDEMHNLPKKLRKVLAERATLGVLEIGAEQVSKDGTVKRAYVLPGGQLIESVLMPYSDGRRTACISSQAGCGMGCTFCATGQMGFARHLTSAEIFEQAHRFSVELKAEGGRLSNVVFMGMGEPLANYDNVLTAVNRIHDELGIGSRHITVSTVGIAPKIRKLAAEPLQLTLAVSLHASNDAARSSIMPINRRFQLDELMAACRDYVRDTGRRVTFEWALIHGENDSVEVARELGQLLSTIPRCHVNIIPLNPTSGSALKPGSSGAMERFIVTLAKFGVPATARVRRGLDIDAGCGQLTQKVKSRRSERAAKATLESTIADDAAPGAE